MPSIIIENLAGDVSVDNITSAFTKFNPNSISVSGGSTAQVSDFLYFESQPHFILDN